MTTVVVTQSNYLPWKGFFDLIRHADRLILLDNVQFTRRDWRSRNRIKTPQGVRWLSVPVNCPDGRSTSISEALIAESRWAEEHRLALTLSYRRSPHFDDIMSIIDPILLEPPPRLSQLNEALIREIVQFMEIPTEISVVRGPVVPDDPSDRIAKLVAGAGGSEYLTGPAARSYLDGACFKRRGIAVRYFAYPTYPEYEQLWPPFRHDVTCLDALFHLGRDWVRSLEGSPP